MPPRVTKRNTNQSGVEFYIVGSDKLGLFRQWTPMHPKEHHKSIYAFIGRRIRERRKQLKLNQSELAKLMGFSYQQMQKYEAGQSRLSAGKLLIFAHMLNVPPAYFYDGLKLDELVNTSDRRSPGYKNKGSLLKVMMIENNPTDIISFQKALNHSNAAVDIVLYHDAENALRNLQQHGDILPDLIITELNLPRLGGLDLIEKVKKNPLTESVPIVILSNSINANDMLTAYRKGAAGFIQKCIDPNEYAESIGALIKYWSKTVLLPCL